MFQNDIFVVYSSVQMGVEKLNAAIKRVNNELAQKAAPKPPDPVDRREVAEKTVETTGSTAAPLAAEPSGKYIVGGSSGESSRYILPSACIG